MTKKQLSGQDMARRERSNAPSGPLADLDQLYDELPSHQRSERMLAQMMRAYRRDILSMRREYKFLREREAAQSLANLHLNHRLEALDTSVRNHLQRYAALRTDWAVQRGLTNQGI